MDAEARRKEILKDARYWLEVADNLFEGERFYDQVEERRIKGEWAREMMRSNDTRQLIGLVNELVDVVEGKQ